MPGSFCDCGSRALLSRAPPLDPRIDGGYCCDHRPHSVVAHRCYVARHCCGDCLDRPCPPKEVVPPSLKWLLDYRPYRGAHGVSRTGLRQALTRQTNSLPKTSREVKNGQFLMHDKVKSLTQNTHTHTRTRTRTHNIRTPQIFTTHTQYAEGARTAPERAQRVARRRSAAPPTARRTAIVTLVRSYLGLALRVRTHVRLLARDGMMLPRAAQAERAERRLPQRRVAELVERARLHRA